MDKPVRTALPDKVIASASNVGRRSRSIAAILVAVLGAGSWLFADWWRGIPTGATPHYVGRTTCAHCHADQHADWLQSDHARAMARATPDTVAGDFAQKEVTHHGQQATMTRRGNEFWIKTAGPDGMAHDYRVDYVFGHQPLQQYLVEMNRPASMGPQQVARLQVLRWTWDQRAKAWFHLDPPDVAAEETLQPDDPLHWTGWGQNWNHMCADCHSTNLRKNFDATNQQYATEFSEIEVSCEACHGPGSHHVELAQAWSPFWDRQRGKALRALRTTSSTAQIEACAACHARRGRLHAQDPSSVRFHDEFESELIRPETYHADGQIRDEVYEYGSFLQSKMYHQGIRCTDCHDPHTARVRDRTNHLCTSCHAHAPTKYDVPAHHHHSVGSSGSQCVSCHMPASPFMKIDWRRDHSLRIPRPDLSLQLKTPNACTACHLTGADGPPAQIPVLTQLRDTVLSQPTPPLVIDAVTANRTYAEWLRIAENDPTAAATLERLDRWSAEAVERWFGARRRPHFAPIFHALWRRDREVIPAALALIGDARWPDIVRASALASLQEFAPESTTEAAARLTTHRHPLVRATAIRCLASTEGSSAPRREVTQALHDPVRWVRIEAARALRSWPDTPLRRADMVARRTADAELQSLWDLHADQAGAQLERGWFAEQQGRDGEARSAYELAIRVQPQVVGPRSHLATLYERHGDAAQAQAWRAAELPLLARQATQLPNLAAAQYRYALALHLQGDSRGALVPLDRACQLEPQQTDFWLTRVLLLEQLHEWTEASQDLERLRSLGYDPEQLQALERRMRAAQSTSGNEK